MRLLCRSLVCAAAVTAVVTPAIAQPRVEEAELHFRLGTTLYRQGRFAEAAAEFATAHRLSQRPELLYNLFVAYRDALDTPRAAEALREYLRLQPGVNNRAVLRAQLDAMDARLRAEAATRPAPAPPAPGATRPTGPAAPPVRADPPPPSRSLALPITLLGVGGAALVAGAITGLTVLGTDADLRAACPGGVCDPSLRADAESGRTRAIVTDVFLGLGLASVATGAVLLFTSGGGESRAPRASAACVPGACGARLQLTF